MRRRAWLLAAAMLVGCSDGESGPAGWIGSDGAAGAVCIATEATDGAITVRCPDGSSAVVAPRTCEETSDEAGTRTIRCPDGTEAVVQTDGETLGAATVVGSVVRAPADTAARGAEIEMVGTGLTAIAAADGSFRIEDVPAGTWSLRVAHAPWRTVELEVSLLAGVWNAGTIALEIAAPLPPGSKVNEDAQAAIMRSPGGFTVLDLVDGSEQLVAAGQVNDVWWIDETVVAMQRWEGSTMAFGLWSRETGVVRWWDEIVEFSARPGGALARRVGAEGTTALWFLWLDEEVELGSPANAGWVAAGYEPIWYVLSDGGLHVIDGRAGTPALVQLDTRRPSNHWYDTELFFADYGAEKVLYDVGGGSITTNAPTTIMNGVARWTDTSGASHVYDGRSGIERIIPAGVDYDWPGNDLGWITYAVDGTWLLVPTSDGEAIELGPVRPASFSPSGARAVWVDDTLLSLLDAVTGETSTVSLPVGFSYDWVEWLDEEWLLFQEAGELYVAGWNGAFFGVGKARDFEHAQAKNGHLLVMAGDRFSVWNLSSWMGIGLGPTYDAVFSSDGRHVVWLDAQSKRLWSMELESTAIRILADRVDGFAALADVVIIDVYVGAPWNHDVATFYMPYL